MAIDPFVRRVIDIYNGHRVEAFDELLTEDCVLVRNGAEASGREAIKKVLDNLYRAFPDIEYTVDDVLVAGDKMALRWQGRGTHRGEYQGMAPSGRRVTYDGITLYELRGNRIARIWVATNVLGVMRSLQAQAPQPEARA